MSLSTMTEMPPVAECLMDQCAYNDKNDCHAYAITVHSGDHTCATFLPTPVHGGLEKYPAKVGACQRVECVHNADLVCSADSVRVGADGGAARCLTFAMS